MVQSKSKFSKVEPYLYLLPAVILFGLFTFYPFFKTIVYSFGNTDTAGRLTGLAGLANYAKLLTDSVFLKSLGVTVVYSLLTVVFSMSIGVFLALMTSEKFPGHKVFRTVYALPMAVSASAAAAIFNFIFHPSIGILNGILGTKIGWLTDSRYALISVVIVTVWMNIGVNYIFALAAVQSGDVPDILQMYEVGTQYMIDLDCYVPVQDFMDANGYDENIIEAVSNYYTYDGKMLSMPFNTSTPVLWINEDICAEAGLDVDNPPTTFAEVLEWSKVIVDGGYCEAGFSAAVYGWYFEQMIAGLGLNYGNNDNGRTSRMTAVEFDSNGALNQVLTTWKEWMDSGYCASYGTTTADTQTAFKAGQVAMILESSGCLGTFMEDCAFEVGNANFPKIEENDDGGVIIGGASMWMIDTGDEERENAAYQFLAFCSQAEQQAYWSTATGYLPVNADAVDTETFSSYAEETPLALTAVNQLLNNPVNVATQGCLTGVSSEARSIFQDNIEALINGQKNIEEAEADITDRINAAIEDYNANNG